MTAASTSPGPSPAPRAGKRLADRLAELYRARELLRQLIRKDLAVRYKDSLLGFAWSLITPAALTVVFTIVFGFLFRLGIEDFAAFFLSGYLAWQFFLNSAQGSTRAITDNGGLIKKVYFPREVLPLSMVTAQMVHFGLALVAVLPYLVWARGWETLLHLPAVLVGVILLAVFTAGMSMLLAGWNAVFRDLQEIVVVVFQVWFYATPIIYPLALVATDDQPIARFFEVVIRINPMTWFVKFFNDAIYGTVVGMPNPDDAASLAELGTDRATVLAARADGFNYLSLAPSWPDGDVMLACLAAAIVVFAVGYWSFHRFADDFAKQL